MSIVAQLRNALEFARFDSPDIRDALTEAIKTLAADLDEVEYDHSVDVTRVFKQLNDAISDFENSDEDTTVVIEDSKHNDVDGNDDVPEVFNARDEVERVLSKPSPDDDDDDIE